MASWPRLKDHIAIASKALTNANEALTHDQDNIELKQCKWEAKEELVAPQTGEEEDCHQRSRIAWLKLGDTNAAYFSKITKEQAIKNTRLCSLESSGNMLTSHEDLANEGIDYFSKLFRKKDIIDSPKWFPRLVTDGMNL